MHVNYIWIVFTLLVMVGLFKLFEKAGEKGWKAFVPVYNLYVWLKIIQRPWWWIILALIPGVGFLMIMIMSVQLSKAFGKTSFTNLLLAAIVPFIYLPYIGFSADVKFKGAEDKSKLRRSATREWVDAIVFAVVAATVIRTFFIEAFTIPTSSMEKTLMIGDYLFVSKLSYGPKLPNTPLSFPFAHHTMPLTKDTKSYFEWMKLPYMRLPGLGSVKSNDIVVFNYPEGDTVVLNHQNQSYYALRRNYGRQNVLNPKFIAHDDPDRIPMGGIVVRPVDKRDNYIKRCIGIPGDKIEIKNGELFVNGSGSYKPPTMQFIYGIPMKSELTRKAIKEFDLTEKIQRDTAGNIYTTLPIGRVDEMQQQPFVGPGQIQRIIYPATSESNDLEIFPNDPRYNWSIDNFGPLTIPQKGVTVSLDMTNLPLYQRIIDVYEENDIEVKNGKIYINGTESSSYTFKMDYYFMMGDNRHNSADSRFWGFVPEDHIVGKAVFVWMSLKQDVPFGEKFRWERFFAFVHDDGLSRSYLKVFLGIIAGIWVFYYFWNRRSAAKKDARKPRNR